MNYISQKMLIGKPYEDIHSISHRSCKLVNLVRIYIVYLTEDVNW